MALVVCCPCGNPVDSDNLDLLVSVECPSCRKELTLELENATGQANRAILTVMEGPYWVGEQFLIPVGVELRIGRSSGNWLMLDDDGVSDTHCRLILTKQGAVVVEDQKSESGTWIGQQRIARGRLSPQQSFKTGDFRFRLDIHTSDGTTIQATPVYVQDGEDLRPALSRAKANHPLVRDRYIYARWMILAFAVLSGFTHLLGLRRVFGEDSAWLWSVLGGLAVAAAISMCGRHVALAHRMFKHASWLLLVFLAIADLVWLLPASAIASLTMASALILLIMLVPNLWLAILGLSLGGIGLLVLLIAVFSGVSKFMGS